jgi:hypothetical protein
LIPLPTTAQYRFGATQSPISIQVDADGMLGRTFTALERENLPFAVMQATNRTAEAVREEWKRQAQRVFDRPTPLTVNAILYSKASKDRLYADVFIRDEAHKGTPPAKYLFPQVEGGSRRAKGLERLLQGRGLLAQGMFAVPGRSAPLDQYGNVRSGVVRKILSQLQAGGEQGYISNESEAGRERRLKRERGLQRKKRGQVSSFFAVGKVRGRLKPGIYERTTTNFGSAVNTIFRFVRTPHYRPRYDIYAFAQRTWDKLMPFFFDRELAKALESSKYRGQL